MRTGLTMMPKCTAASSKWIPKTRTHHFQVISPLDKPRGSSIGAFREVRASSTARSRRQPQQHLVALVVGMAPYTCSQELVTRSYLICCAIA